MIALLSKAYECFKKEKSTRMILHIAYQIGLEYYHSGHFELAKQFFDSIAPSYRQEQWFAILSTILLAAYECGRKLGLAK